MPLLSVKERVLHAIQRLPEDADFRDVNEEIALLAAVAEAEEDIHEGRLLAHETVMSRIGDLLNG
jgi:predicted transcriptional regulator